MKWRFSALTAIKSETRDECELPVQDLYFMTTMVSARTTAQFLHKGLQQLNKHRLTFKWQAGISEI